MMTKKTKPFARVLWGAVGKHAILAILCLPLTGIPSAFCQSPEWKLSNMGLGFGRVYMLSNPESEGAVFNPYMNFNISHHRSLFSYIGFKADINFQTNWIYTRNDFVKSMGGTAIQPHPSVNLNTYLRSSQLMMGIGPQIRLQKVGHRHEFISILYAPVYNIFHKGYSSTENDAGTQEKDLGSLINPLRHWLVIELNSVHERSSENFSLLNGFTIRASMDLNGYARGGDFRQVNLGFLFSF